MILEARSRCTKIFAVSLMMNTNIIANKIDKGTEITITTHVRDKDATFCYAASAPKAE